jgi:hypothetical protein
VAVANTAQPQTLAILMAPSNKNPSSPWPAVPQHVIDGLVQFLIEEQRMCRPPEQAARLLAYIVQLHKKGMPWPSRREVSERLGISIATIDAAISARLADGYITHETRIVEGNVKKRKSSVKEKYLVPSQDLVDAFDRLYRKRPR